MFIDYIVDLKYDNYLCTFECFLSSHHIPYEVLNDLVVFRIKTTPTCACYIRTFPYVNYVIKDVTVTPDDEVSTSEDSRTSNFVSRGASNFIIPPSDEWFKRITGVTLQWRNNITGKGVKVALIDSGVQDHDAIKLAGSVRFTQRDTFGQDATGTGTKKAGIIAARAFDKGVIGVAYDCSLYSVRVLENNGQLVLWSLYEAIEWCIDNNINIAAITLSLDSTAPIDPQLLDRLSESIIKADRRGLIVLGPVGNNGHLQVNIPASLYGCFSITGVKLDPPEALNIQNLRLLPGSNTGQIDFQAPGAGIATTAPNNTFTVDYASTGAAAAYFAGGIALILSEYPKTNSYSLLGLLPQFVIKTPLTPIQGGYGLAFYAPSYDVID